MASTENTQITIHDNRDASYTDWTGEEVTITRHSESEAIYNADDCAVTIGESEIGGSYSLLVAVQSLRDRGAPAEILDWLVGGSPAEMIEQLATYDMSSATVDPDDGEWTITEQPHQSDPHTYRLDGTAEEVLVRMIEAQRNRTADAAVGDWTAEETDVILARCGIEV